MRTNVLHIQSVDPFYLALYPPGEGNPIFIEEPHSRDFPVRHAWSSWVCDVRATHPINCLWQLLRSPQDSDGMPTFTR